MLVSEENFNSENFQAKGIIGLGLPDPNAEYSNYMMDLFSKGVIASPKFGFYLSDSKQEDSKFFFGDFSIGTLISPFYKQMSYCQVDQYSTKWSCNIDRLEVNKNIKYTTSNFVIDTATSYIYVPIADFKLIKKFLIDNTQTECVRNEINQLLCKCEDPTIFPDINLSIHNDIFTIKSKHIIDYFPNLPYQCRFELIVDFDNDDTWTLGTAALKNTLFNFDFYKRKIGFIQFSEEIRKIMMRDNLMIEEQDNTEVYFLYLGFLIFIFVVFVKIAKRINRIQNNRSGSFDYENMDDIKTVEQIKNKFNDEEYDYDGDIKNTRKKPETNNEKKEIDDKPRKIELKEIK